MRDRPQVRLASLDNLVIRHVGQLNILHLDCFFHFEAPCIGLLRLVLLLPRKYFLADVFDNSGILFDLGMDFLFHIDELLLHGLLEDAARLEGRVASRHIGDVLAHSVALRGEQGLMPDLRECVQLPRLLRGLTWL